jgi:ferredoxin--NADP+ reductase
LVTKKLQELIDSGRRLDYVLAIGPVPMMRAVAQVTREKGIKTVVSLNSIMVDGTGMCGGCRVLVEGHSQFACVDGPEFDAQKVNFEVLMQRNNMYRESEKRSLDAFLANPEAELQQVRESCRLRELEERARSAPTKANTALVGGPSEVTRA